MVLGIKNPAYLHRRAGKVGIYNLRSQKFVNFFKFCAIFIECFWGFRLIHLSGTATASCALVLFVVRIGGLVLIADRVGHIAETCGELARRVERETDALDTHLVGVLAAATAHSGKERAEIAQAHTVPLLNPRHHGVDERGEDHLHLCRTGTRVLRHELRYLLCVDNIAAVGKGHEQFLLLFGEMELALLYFDCY